MHRILLGSGTGGSSVSSDIVSSPAVGTSSSPRSSRARMLRPVSRTTPPTITPARGAPPSWTKEISRIGPEVSLRGMRRTIDRLGTEPLVGDGGMGSMLSAAVPQARCAEHANTLAPETVVRLPVDFIQAGADVIQTNTYGASPHKLARHGLEEEFERLVLAGVKLAREAREVAGRDVLIAGSIGPLGAASEHGEVGEPQLYARQAELLESR